MMRCAVPLMLSILTLLTASCAGWRGGPASLHRPEDCPLDPARPYEESLEDLVGEDANEFERMWARNALAECRERRGEFRRAYEDYYATRGLACEIADVSVNISLDAEVARRYCDEYGPQALERVGSLLSPQEREEIQALEEEDQSSADTDAD